MPLPDDKPNWKLENSMFKLESVEEQLLREVTRLKQALASAHEALLASGPGAKKDRAVQATLRVLEQARKA